MYESDSLVDQISYSDVSKNVLQLIETSSFKCIEAFALFLIHNILNSFKCDRVRIKAEKLKALLVADSAGIEISREKSFSEIQLVKGTIIDAMPDDHIFISNLIVPVIIGMNSCERLEKQTICINAKIYLKSQFAYENLTLSHNYRFISKAISAFVENSKYKTLEALTFGIIQHCQSKFEIKRLCVTVEKLKALTFAASAGVTIEQCLESVSCSDSVESTAYIAFGSNLGNRLANINLALKELEDRGIKVLDTSFLYESSPAYVLDQPFFLNGVAKISTLYAPLELLKVLKEVELKVGRVQSFLNGPRAIDLDVLFYDDITFENNILTIPHPRIAERLFVLCPLHDIAPNLEHPVLFRTCEQLLNICLNERKKEVDVELHRVLPLRNQFWKWDKRTMIMGILNVTPDSFSDGGLYVNTEKALERALEMIEEGADLIDIGGMSTRPNADEISAEEEIRRIVPVIKAIRSVNNAIPISVDTYRSVVAKCAVEAGADFVNDISGGSRDPEMLPFMASSNIPVCLMHSRGDSKTMMTLTQYAENNELQTIKAELDEKVGSAISAGVRRWNIVLDPGIGFAKTAQQNVHVLRDMSRTAHTRISGFPLLIGVSRKSFIGKITGKEDPLERKWGNAAAVAASIAAGASVVRVHDVANMVDVIKVSDAIWH